VPPPCPLASAFVICARAAARSIASHNESEEIAVPVAVAVAKS